MEREQPTTHPSGEHVPVRDRLQDVPARQALRLVGIDDDATGESDKVAGLPDLSVSDEAEMMLLRSGWAGVIELFFAQSSATQHRGWLRLIMLHLKNRTAVPKVHADHVRVDFQVEDGTAATRERVEDFARHLAEFAPGGVERVEVRFNPLDDDVIEAILEEDRPRLRAL